MLDAPSDLNESDEIISHNSSVLEQICQVYYAFFVSMIAITCLAGNTLVIKYMLQCKPESQSPCNYFILSLACSDTLQGIVYSTYNILHIIDVHVEDDGCKWVIFALCVPLKISSYSLVGLTIARFFAVYKPNGYRQCLSIPTHRNLLKCAVAAIWFSATGLSAFMYLGLYDAKEVVDYVCRYELQYSLSHAVSMLCILAVVPALLMTGFYLAMIYCYKKLGADSPMRRNQSNVELKAKIESSMARAAGKLIIVYVIALSPVWIYIIVYKVCLYGNSFSHCEYGTCPFLPFIRATVRIFSFANSAVNVFIYAGQNVKFRAAVKRDLGILVSCIAFIRERCYLCQIDGEDEKNETVTMTITSD